MKISISSLLFFVLSALSIIAGAQSSSFPQSLKKKTQDIYIKSITTTDKFTQINFIYKNSRPNGIYILLHPPGHRNAYYIHCYEGMGYDGKDYKLLSTQNIADVDGKTEAMPNVIVEFSARFEKLPLHTIYFDLLEGSGGTWDFFGVKLDPPASTYNKPASLVGPNYKRKPEQSSSVISSVDASIAQDYNVDSWNYNIGNVVDVASSVGWIPSPNGLFKGSFSIFKQGAGGYLNNNYKAMQQLRFDGCYNCKKYSEHYFNKYNSLYSRISFATWRQYCPILYNLMTLDFGTAP